jgi:AcrR family transcriptional regulator
VARPREFDEAKALEKAIKCFWERGYEATSMRDLATKMGISAPSLYNTYGDKHARSPSHFEPAGVGALAGPDAGHKERHGIETADRYCQRISARRLPTASQPSMRLQSGRDLMLWRL